MAAAVGATAESEGGLLASSLGACEVPWSLRLRSVVPKRDMVDYIGYIGFIGSITIVNVVYKPVYNAPQT